MVYNQDRSLDRFYSILEAAWTDGPAVDADGYISDDSEDDDDDDGSGILAIEDGVLALPPPDAAETADAGEQDEKPEPATAEAAVILASQEEVVPEMEVDATKATPAEHDPNKQTNPAITGPVEDIGTGCEESKKDGAEDDGGKTLPETKAPAVREEQFIGEKSFSGVCLRQQVPGSNACPSQVLEAHCNDRARIAELLVYGTGIYHVECVVWSVFVRRQEILHRSKPIEPQQREPAGPFKGAAISLDVETCIQHSVGVSRMHDGHLIIQ